MFYQLYEDNSVQALKVLVQLPSSAAILRRRIAKLTLTLLCIPDLCSISGHLADATDASNWWMPIQHSAYAKALRRTYDQQARTATQV